MRIPPLFVALALLVAETAFAQPAPTSEPKIVGPGLTFLRYGVQPSQVTATNYDGYVPYTDLLAVKPLSGPRTVYEIGKWEKDIDENAMLIGCIRIEKPGSYSFKSSSGYDRNELVIDGKVVCKFRNGEEKGETVELREGLLPIVSVGYVKATKEVRVQWIPPDETEWADIPKKLLYRTKVEVPK